MIGNAKHFPSILLPYTFRYGKFRVELCYETYVKPPRWHAMVSIMEEIGELEFGAMQEALLALESWTEGDFNDARKILGECLAPEILRHKQMIHEHRGLWALHQVTEDEHAGSSVEIVIH